MPLFSFIIPVFNRPNEVEELLQSLTQQTVDSSMFEVIVVEDGSQITCKEVCERFLNNWTYIIITKKIAVLDNQETTEQISLAVNITSF